MLLIYIVSDCFPWFQNSRGSALGSPPGPRPLSPVGVSLFCRGRTCKPATSVLSFLPGKSALLRGHVMSSRHTHTHTNRRTGLTPLYLQDPWRDEDRSGSFLKWYHWRDCGDRASSPLSSFITNRGPRPFIPQRTANTRLSCVTDFTEGLRIIKGIS